MLSFKKNTPTLLANNSCVYFILSTVFLENLDISFVNIKLNLPVFASLIILRKLSRLFTLVPDIPSST